MRMLALSSMRTWACLQVLDASSYATLEAARHSGASSAPGLSAVVPPPKGIAPSFLPAAGGSGAPPPSSFEEDEPMHSASVSLDAARSQRSGIEVVARPHDASPSKDAIVPASGGPRDPLAGDAEWPASVPDGPRFVAFTLRCASLCRSLPQHDWLNYACLLVCLSVVYEAGRTGFEEVKEFQAPLGSVIAGRYVFFLVAFCVPRVSARYVWGYA